ncbi:hypothetical protein AB1Y20_009518 [Prymnesium parvum]|uniref:Amino acid permease n=1 Tax=Prymnesium parvum TaxID=97485 RepID=A0AB34K455_PRYPA
MIDLLICFTTASLSCFFFAASLRCFLALSILRCFFFFAALCFFFFATAALGCFFFFATAALGCFFFAAASLCYYALALSCFKAWSSLDPPHMSGTDEYDGHGSGAKSSRSPRLRPSLQWYHLVGVTFFAVCGGDYGLEDAVGAGGPCYTLVGLLLLPWCWSLPIALMTAELSAMIPETGGYVVWVRRAFGPFWAHQNALWNLVANAFDNALYPVMFVDYLRYFPALRIEGWGRWLISIGMLFSVTSLNLVGVDVVASASNVFALLVIAPFAALTLAGLPEVNPSAWWGAPPTTGVHWGTFLSVLLWNTSGYDSIGALAAEVQHPGRDFPRAMGVTITLVTLVYLLPLLVALSMDADNLDRWTDGHFTVVAAEHVGEWLSAWISIGGALSAMGLLNTLLCTSARVAVSAARMHVLPSCLGAVHEPSSTPRAATLCIAALLAVACTLPFSELVSISMLFYGATTLMEFLALLRLRQLEPLTSRPYRIPLGRWGLTLASLPPIALCLLLVWLASFESWVILGASTVMGVATYVHVHSWRAIFSRDAHLGGYGQVTSVAPAGPERPDHIDTRAQYRGTPALRIDAAAAAEGAMPEDDCSPRVEDASRQASPLDTMEELDCTHEDGNGESSCPTSPLRGSSSSIQMSKVGRGNTL